MTRALVMGGLLSFAGLLVGLTNVVGEEQAADRGSVVGTVVARGVGTPAQLEVFRLADLDPLGYVEDRLAPGSRHVENEFARDFGAVRGEPERVLHADDEGRFAIDSLKIGRYVIWARDARGRAGGEIFTLEVAGARHSVTVNLTNGTRDLTARVLLRENEPFRGHVVVLRRDEHGDRWKVGRYPTDASGLLVARGVPRSDLQLVLVTADGWAAVSPQYPWPGADEIEWIVAPGEEQEISGHVVSDAAGEAIEGATVHAVSPGRGRSLLVVRGTTDAEGRFVVRVAGVAPRVRASAPGMSRSGFQSPSGGDAGTLRLTARRSLRGRVVRKDSGEALEGVRVVAYRMTSGPRFAVVTDGDGRFSFDGLWASEWMVFAMGDGWLSDGVWDVEGAADNPFVLRVGEGRTGELTLEAVPSAPLEGVVLDAAGAPVPGAVVDPELECTPASDSRPMWAWATSRPVATGEDGTFRHDDLLPGGTYEFHVTAPGYPALTSRSVVVKPGGANQPLRLVLRNDRFLDVRVVDAGTNRPVSEAWVQPVLVERHGPRLYGVDIAGTQGVTGAEGRVRLGPLPAGRLGVEVDAPEHAHLLEPLEVPEACTGADARPFVVKLETGKSIAGVLRLPEGVRGSDFLLRAYVLDVGGAPPGAERTTRVAPDGSFRVVGLRAARYRLAACMRNVTGTWSGGVEVDAPATAVEVALEFRPPQEPGRRRRGPGSAGGG